MVFSSSIFLFCFLPIILILYYNPWKKGRKYRNYLLFFGSLLFYAFGEPIYVLLLLFSILINFFLGLFAERFRLTKQRKIVIIVALVYNLSFLFVFKYLGFVLHNLNLLFGKERSDFSLLLPIGISFFTFQALSYVLDIIKGKGKAQKNLFHTGLYIALFPQLIAGPIVRYETVAEEIENRKETLEEFTFGVVRFMKGLAKKVLISNTLAPLADLVFSQTTSFSVPAAWLGLLAYTFQIYFDFSGYSDMAIGLGQMFGFHFLENFNYPYVSFSISEFWRRWHISLGSWFRDYVYIPLGGSQVGKGRLVFNLFVVWSLTGFWHGAEWTFLIWGLLYFILLTGEKLLSIPKKRSCFGLFYTMFFVMIGWVFFRAENLTEAMTYLKALFGLQEITGKAPSFLSLLRTYGAYFLFALFSSAPIFPFLQKRFGQTKWWNVCDTIFLFFLMIWTISAVVNSSYNPFIYFNF